MRLSRIIASTALAAAIAVPLAAGAQQSDKEYRFVMVSHIGSTRILSVGNEVESPVAKSTDDGVLSANPEFFFLHRHMRAYEAEWNRFVEAVMHGGDLPGTVQDGVNALAVAEAAVRSYNTGKMAALSADMLGPAI